MRRAGLSRVGARVGASVRAPMVISAQSFMGFLALLVMAALTASPVLAAPCESLASLKLPNTTITSANTVAAGTFTLPTGGGLPSAGPQFSTLPAFCRVAATLTPSSDSDIKVEVWLPVSGWNGKFQAVGNGGFAGVISYPALAAAVKAGYASASTDTGHQGNTAAFAIGHPEKVIDFADRAVHEMTVQAKSIVNAYYGGAPSLSFWNGCSQGGRQGITEAAKYPADFDGIVAGGPPASTGCASLSPVWQSTCSSTEAKTVTSRPRNMRSFTKP